MGYPSLSGESPGYPEDSGLRTKGSSFKGKNLYLVHGSADDNVHIQNTDILSQALVKENIQFKLQVNDYLVQQHPGTFNQNYFHSTIHPPGVPGASKEANIF